MVPQIFLFLSPPPKAAVSKMGTAGAPTGAPMAPKGGAQGTTPPEGEGNPAEGGYFASIYYTHIYIYHTEKYISDFFQIERNMIVETVFLLIMNQIKFQLVRNQKENCKLRSDSSKCAKYRKSVSLHLGREIRW